MSMARLTIPDKLSFVLLAWACAFLLAWEYNIAVILLLLLLPVLVQSFKPVSASGRKYFFRFLVYSSLLVVALLIANGLLVHDGGILFSYSFLTMHRGGVEYGLTVSVRLMILSLSILLFFTSVHFRDLVTYLESTGLPAPLASVILLSLFFLEQIPKRISLIFTAQEARGAPVRAGTLSRVRSFFLLLSPLVLSSIVESSERGAALELRGYGRYRTLRDIERVSTGSLVWRIVCIVLTMMVLTLGILRWLSSSR